ncbi:hypothetical protein OS493_011868 [Desmophyllum pertusum]|uniref:Uncharacterized protein n=1 Tax=Desmophyllum pertusum TaxID=174260 RepID=A0A9W9YHE9_9CNID|nr:hypothetical protein OS493_011868 [Desmophyllum pertusum]
MSGTLAGQASVLHKNMSGRWPSNLFNGSDIDFFGPRRSFNKTAVKPQQILKAHIHILRAFIPLMDNSTNQLSRFQVVGDLVTRQLNDLKRQTKTLINSYLRRITTIITSGRGGQKNTAPQGGQQKTNTDNKPASLSVQTKPFNTASMGSPTIHDVALRTQLILADFTSNVLTLRNDLQKIAKQTCN